MFGKALVKGEITFTDLAKSLGNTVKAKIDYFAQNTKHVFAGKPTNKEVRRYGYEVGEILTMIGGSSAAVKLVTKVAPKLAKLLEAAGKAKSALKEAYNAAFKAVRNADSFKVSNKYLKSAGGKYSKFSTDNAAEVNKMIKEGLRSTKAHFLPNN